MTAAANGSTAIVPATPDSYEGLTMVTSPTEALRRVQELQAFVVKVMVDGVDYGAVPGSDRKTLLQPGAQKLEEIYGFAHRFEDVEMISDWDRPLFLFRKRCILTLRRDGRYVGDGIGSCNSREDKYAWRWLWEKPKGIPEAELVTRRTKNGKTQWRVPNTEVFSLLNTIEKMACKRALVHAVIGVTRSSGLFTQDVEDLPEEAFGKAEEHRSWETPDEERVTKDGEVISIDAVEGELLKRIAGATSVEPDLVAIYKDMQAARLPSARSRKVTQALTARKRELTPRIVEGDMPGIRQPGPAA